jgi:hypothetical protein
MTEYKTINGEMYMFAGCKMTGVEVEIQAAKYRAQGRICRVVIEERAGIRRGSGYRSVHAIYTRSK